MRLIEKKEGEYVSYLSHYGVKGMKWGVRKNRKTESNKKYSKKSEKKQRVLQKIDEFLKKYGGNKSRDFINQHQDIVQRMHMQEMENWHLINQANIEYRQMFM